jgi:hypothetical protein
VAERWRLTASAAGVERGDAMRAALALVAPTDRALVKERARWLGDDVWRWAGMSGVRVDRRLVERLAAVVAAVALDIDRDRMALLSRYVLWTVLLDDRLDEPDADVDTLYTLLARVSAVVSGDGPALAGAESALVRDGDLLDGLLDDLLAEFRACAEGAEVLARLTDALCDAVRAGIEHALLAREVRLGRASPPSVADYLAMASRDVNYRSFAYGLTLLAGERLDGGVLCRIDRALAPASRAVRLANDLRTVERDRAARRFNVLMLRGDDGSAVRVGAVQRQITDHVRRHDRLLRKIPVTDAKASIAALVNSLRVAVGVYRVADLR